LPIMRLFGLVGFSLKLKRVGRFLRQAKNLQNFFQLSSVIPLNTVLVF